MFNFYIICILIIISILIYGYTSEKINTEILINKLTYNKSLQHSLINYGLILFGLFCYQSSLAYKTLTIATIFQLLILVFVKPAVGVSLIWSGLLGLSLLRCKTNKERAYLIASLLIILYYAFTFPFETTFAHVATALVSFLFIKYKY